MPGFGSICGIWPWSLPAGRRFPRHAGERASPSSESDAHGIFVEGCNFRSVGIDLRQPGHGRQLEAAAFCSSAIAARS